MRNVSNYLLSIILGLMLMAFSQAPEQIVSGQVKSGGDPLPGVDVSVQGSNEGTVTNMKGEYSLQADADDTLVFSSLGYVNKKVAVSGKSTINVNMSED